MTAALCSLFVTIFRFTVLPKVHLFSTNTTVDLTYIIIIQKEIWKVNQRKREKIWRVQIFPKNYGKSYKKIEYLLMLFDSATSIVYFALFFPLHLPLTAIVFHYFHMIIIFYYKPKYIAFNHQLLDVLIKGGSLGFFSRSLH